MNKPVEVLLTNIANLFKVKTIITFVMLAGLLWGFVNGVISGEVYAGFMGSIITYFFMKQKETPSS